MTRLKLDFDNYEGYLRTLGRNTRSQLRKKFKESEARASLEMRIVTDITPYINEVYPLYLAVWQKSSLQFEKATPDYFCKIGQNMPDKALFFLWYLEGKIVAFNYCLLHDAKGKIRVFLLTQIRKGEDARAQDKDQQEPREIGVLNSPAREVESVPFWLVLRRAMRQTHIHERGARKSPAPAVAGGRAFRDRQR